MHRCGRVQHKQNRDCVVAQYKARLIYFPVLESSETTSTRTYLKMMEVKLWIRTWTMDANLFFEKFFFFELWIFHFWWKFFDRFSPFFLDRNFWWLLISSIFREDFDFSLLWSSFIVRECSCDAIQSEFKWPNSLTPPLFSLFLDPLSFTRIWRKRLFFFCLFLSLYESMFLRLNSRKSFRNFGNS